MNIANWYANTINEFDANNLHILICSISTVFVVFAFNLQYLHYIVMFTKLLSHFYLSRHKFTEYVFGLLDFLYIRMYLIVIIGLILLNWLFVYIININVSQDLVVLHYNVDFGVNLIGSVKQVYIIPLMGLIVFIINLVLSVFVNKQDKFFTHLLLGATMLVNVFLFIAISSVYLVNFYR